MNATPEQQKRVALAIKPDAAHVVWVKLDQTGQPPRVIDDMIKPRLELISLDDSPIAIYRADTDESYTRDSLAALAELVQVVNGMPNVSADVDEQMRQLREQLRATVENATETFNKYEARIARDEHRIEKIIKQARYWKQRAQQRRIYVEHYQEQERTLRAEISALEGKLRVARNAVDRAVNRSNHSNEHVDRARQEAASLRQQLGQATAEAHDLRERIVEVQANALDTINRVAAALPAPVIDAEVVTPDVVVDTWFGEDNVPVVQIDTEGGHGRLRINLNDGVVWDGNPETDERPGSYAEPEEFSNEAARAADGATISRQLDTIRDQAERIEALHAERDAALRERDRLKGQSQSWERVYYHPALRQFTEEDGVAVEQVMEGISKLAEWRETIREQYVQTVAERDAARADAEKLREINEIQRQGIEASAEANKLTARLVSVGATTRQIDAALRVFATGRITMTDALTLAPSETDPLGVLEATRQRDEATAEMRTLRGERNTFEEELANSETMRKRLDEQLASERRVYETTSAALRAMIRERDAVLDVAERAMYPHAHGETKSRLIGEYRDARGRLPRLESEADARKDESIRKMIAAVDQAVRFWRRSPANVMTEQLNIALSNLAESI